jgi:quercetin dioxygenase-like cupin family protein
MLVRRLSAIEAIAYGDGIKKRIAIGENEGAPTFVMRIFDLSAGASTPFHTHDWEHEVFILSGKGVVVSEDGDKPVGPEDIIFVPPDEKHCLRNTGQDTFRFMCLVPLRGEQP